MKEFAENSHIFIFWKIKIERSDNFSLDSSCIVSTRFWVSCPVWLCAKIHCLPNLSHLLTISEVWQEAYIEVLPEEMKSQKAHLYLTTKTVGVEMKLGTWDEAGDLRWSWGFEMKLGIWDEAGDLRWSCGFPHGISLWYFLILFTEKTRPGSCYGKGIGSRRWALSRGKHWKLWPCMVIFYIHVTYVFFVHLVGTRMSFRYPLYHGKSLASVHDKAKMKTASRAGWGKGTKGSWWTNTSKANDRDQSIYNI